VEFDAGRSSVCVSGLARDDECAWFTRLPQELAWPDEVELRLGLLVSPATCQGEGRGAVVRDLERLGWLLERLHAVATPALHWCGGRDPDFAGQLLEGVRAACAPVARHVALLQLNVATPSLGEILRLRAAWPGIRLILQLPLWQEALREAAARRDFILRYREVVEYFLLDPSGGRGQAGVSEALSAVDDVLADGLDPARLVLAGGLGAAELPDLLRRSCVRTNSRLVAIDAQQKLRGGSCEGRPVGDALNPKKVADYLRAFLLAGGGSAVMGW